MTAERVYGAALYELAVGEDKVDSFLREVGELAEIFSSCRELSAFLAHPEIPGEEKRVLLEKLFSGQISEELLFFLCLIVKKNRSRNLIGIFTDFSERVREGRRIGRARVISAAELSDLQKRRLEACLIRMGSKKYDSCEVEYQVNPDILGGFILQMGNRIWDGSLKAKLARLKRELMEEKR